MSFTIDYQNGVWYAVLPREAQAAAEELRAQGWKFHWGSGDPRCYHSCGGCRADLPPFARFTWLAERAAPFRDHFSPAAEEAFVKASATQKKSKERAEAVYKRSFAVDDSEVKLETPAPPGLQYRPYQRAGIEWIVNREATLLGDPPGLGKTIQVLGAINALPDVREVLVVAPSALAANWAREANRWVDRTVHAVFMRDSSDIPPPAPKGEVNVMSMSYDSIPQTKGADLSEVLWAKPKKNGNPRKQTDYMGLRRALKKVANRPSLRRVLVVAQADEPIAWDKAPTSKIEQIIGKPTVFVCRTPEDVEQAQSWMAKNPNDLAVVVIHPPPEEVALAALSDGEQPYTPMLKLAAHFTMPGQRTSTAKKASSGYDMVLTDKLYTLRTMGRGLGLVDDLMQRPLDMLVLDEAHVLNNPKNETSIGVFGKWDRANQLSRGLADIAKRRVYLTGTPIRNQACEIWGSLRSLAPKTFNNFFRFAQQYCDAHEDNWGHWHFDGLSNEEELAFKLRSGTEHGGLLIRRKKAEVEKDLPPKTRIVLPLPAPEEAEDLIAEEWTDAADLDESIDLLETQAMIAEAEGNEAAYKTAVEKLRKTRDLAFDEIARERVKLAHLKIKPAVEFIEGLLDGGVQKVGIFATHRVVVDGLTEALRKHGKIAIVDGRVAGKGRVVPKTGDPNVMDRIDVVDAFQNDPDVRIFIGNYKAAKEGWTLTAASTAVMVESTWTGADNEQAEDRFHRIGTVNPVTIYYLAFDGSLDQKMLEAVVRKMEIADAVLDRQYGGKATGKSLSGIDRVKLTETLVQKPAAQTQRERPEIKYTEEQREAARAGIQMLAAVCDGAMSRDCQGFSGGWVEPGHWLAAQPVFDDRKTAIAVRAITHHQRQIPEDILEVLGIRRRGQASEPPVRYRLRKRGSAWYVELTTTMVGQPVQKRMLYRVASHEGGLVDGTVLTKTNTYFVWEGGSATLAEDTEPQFEEELGIPQPKTKKEVRWKNGHWQRMLATGWKDFEPVWIDDPSQAVKIAKAPSPKAPTPKAPTPKTPTPKTPKAAPSKRRSVEQPALHIQDPHAFEVLSDIEGPVWAELQRRDKGRLRMDNGFYLNLAAYMELAAMGKKMAEGITLMDLDDKAGILEGTKGTAYVVMPDGEIMLLADTTTKTKARKLAKIMQVVEE